jgi:uncharacterized protein YbjT (DUF2867 family)
VGQTPTLITGATGFVGSHLVEALRDGARPVRVIARDASKLDHPDGLDVVEGDLDDEAALERALSGCSCAYYLVHSMEPGDDGKFAERDRELAERFVEVAGRLDVGRLIYLTGVVPEGDASAHLDSRHQVENILGGGQPELVSLRASMIVGAQSDSFRTLAQIVERLPVLALPSWRDNRTQPVAIDDVVAALVAAESVEAGVYEIAGPDTLTIEEIVRAIGELNGVVRPSIPLPFSSSRLEGATAALVTDSSREVLEPLMEGLHEDLCVEDNELTTVFGVTPTPFRVAAASALEQMSEVARAA